MNNDWQTRTSLLLQTAGIAELEKAHVWIAGTGGVGAYAAEMLCRAGVGHLTLIDADVINESNINRQLIALHSTVGKSKTDLMATRLRDINPHVQLTLHALFLDESNIAPLLDDACPDFVVDAIDTITPKVTLITEALHRKIPIISSMGAGGRVDPTQLRYADIADTYHCTLAKVVRRQLRERGIKRGLKVVFSTEQPDRKAVITTSDERNKKSTIGTISYLPAMFGCYLAAYVIRKLTGK